MGVDVGCAGVGLVAVTLETGLVSEVEVEPDAEPDIGPVDRFGRSAGVVVGVAMLKQSLEGKADTL